MANSIGDRSHGYEMPPTLPHCLASGTTWGLLCRDCKREVVVDVIKLVEGVEDVCAFDADATFARARCSECGGKMWNHRGFTLGSLKHVGAMPRLVTADGSDWRRPDWRTLGRPLI
jgi:hypothetical protein